MDGQRRDLWEDYQFNGSYLPLASDDYKMAGVFTATAAGEIVIAGRLDGTAPAVFLNALRISALASAPVVDLGGTLLSEFLADNESGITDEDRGCVRLAGDLERDAERT